VRIACLLVPDLPLRAELRAHPELAGRPLAVASGPDARAEVIALSTEARAAGVPTACSAAHARTICPALRIRVVSPAVERAARDALLDAALACSPRAAPVPPSGGAFAAEAAVWADAGGVSALFRSEEGFATALGARAAALGLEGVATVASSRAIALLAARARHLRDGPGSVLVLRARAERRFLDPLPLDLLDPDDALAQALTRFGVRTVRDLLRLPRRALARRLGPQVLELAARARGEAVEAPLPAPSRTRLEEAVDLELPADCLEPLLFVLRGILSRLMERLALRGLAAPFLDLDLRLAGRGRDARRIGVSAPTRDVRVWLRLASLSLESRPPEAAVEGVGAATEGSARRSDQLDLFRPPAPDPAALDPVLAELASLCGEGRVGAPEVGDDHRPDAFQVKAFRPGDPPPAAPRPPGAAFGVRALRPPVAAEVRLARGAPVQVRSAVASGAVLAVSGPWRTTGRWWSEEERYAVDHYDVQVDDGTVLRLCFDWIRRSWRVDAIYD
jgi:protein ImuB